MRFEFEFEHEGVPRRAEVILTGPSGEAIDSFLKDGFERLDRVLPRCLGGPEGLVEYVFTYSQGDLTFRFAVRSDAVPLFPESKRQNPIMENTIEPTRPGVLNADGSAR